MIKILWFFLQFAFFSVSTTATSNRLQAIPIKSNQTARSCLYTVIIKTSCSSVSYTTDKVSLAFGDAYGNEVYAARVDDPDTRTFERCSTYVFELQGPCMDVICYLSLLRNGSDGWRPESTKIYGPDLRPIMFYIDTFYLMGYGLGLLLVLVFQTLHYSIMHFVNT